MRSGAAWLQKTNLCATGTQDMGLCMRCIAAVAPPVDPLGPAQHARGTSPQPLGAPASAFTAVRLLLPLLPLLLCMLSGPTKLSRCVSYMRLLSSNPTQFNACRGPQRPPSAAAAWAERPSAEGKEFGGGGGVSALQQKISLCVSPLPTPVHI